MNPPLKPIKPILIYPKHEIHESITEEESLKDIIIKLKNNKYFTKYPFDIEEIFFSCEIEKQYYDEPDIYMIASLYVDDLSDIEYCDLIKNKYDKEMILYEKKLAIYNEKVDEYKLHLMNVDKQIKANNKQKKRSRD